MSDVLYQVAENTDREIERAREAVRLRLQAMPPPSYTCGYCGMLLSVQGRYCSAECREDDEHEQLVRSRTQKR